MAQDSFCPTAALTQLLARVAPEPGTKPAMKLVLAYSGGVDSEVLAYGLSRFAKQHPEFNYLLVHVHHGLSANADSWQSHCERRAREYGLPISVKRVTVASGARISLEAAAREARYDALLSELASGDILLTAHHQDDQLETLLLALKRGLGPKGLAAMGAVQAFTPENLLLRPLLTCSRAQIEAFAKAQGLEHIEDESNQDSRFDRNFLRNEVLPTLTARWPAFAATASRSAQLCAEQQALIYEEVNLRLPAMLMSVPYSRQPVLDLSVLAQEPKRWRPHLLRGFIEHSGFALPSAAQLADILAQLEAKADAQVAIRIKSMVLRRFQQSLYLDPVEVEPRCEKVLSGLSLDTLSQGASELSWPLDSHSKLVAKWGMTGPRLLLEGDEVTLRFGAPGALRCHPHGRDKGRELKKLWQEFAVPPWERGRIPLIFAGEHLVAAVGLWVDKRYLAAEGEGGWQFSLA
ncbi:tRNA lysidine(34) synthetase TilS [Shewanella sp. Isolate8]|uniref:tRNA lysidine(34) synthetase TilS n=1 Tax=Shewanella sp. Isolate8 TaxID=2908529 RepID=UPI001EFE7DB1|nr:tRNA lysidine(34) synthetase TilS [Shewanella sp. Isolate8]MCG9747131.1 tRNA lysidine(34) synthetase TilS [Shewanella sp. Isolate8]